MELIEFPEQNVVFAKNQPQYRPLPAHRVPNDPLGRVIFCWQLSPEELATIQETGAIWHHVCTFNHPLQPQLLMAEKPVVHPPECDIETVTEPPYTAQEYELAIQVLERRFKSTKALAWAMKELRENLRENRGA